MEKVKVQVEKYKASDGKLFDTSKECEFYEKKINGEIKTCDNCNGTGIVDSCGDGRMLSPCSRCNGKGYLIKVKKWQ